MNASDVDLLADGAPFGVLTVTVAATSGDVAVCTSVGGTRAVLPVTAFYPNRTWTVGGRYHLAASGDPHRPELSAVRDELPVMLFDGLVPELRDGRVRVMGVSRQPGIRCKVAVASTCEGVDPVGSLLGRGAGRVRTVSAMMLGERVDVVAWHVDPERFALNALAVSSASASTVDGTIVVAVPQHQYSAALGGGNLNATLAARLLGCRVRVVPA